MKQIYTFGKRLSAVVAIISFVGVFAAMLFTALDIVLRYVFNRPILGSYEIIELTMSCIVFASFAYTQMEKGHIQIIMVLRKLPTKLRLVLFTINSFLSAGLSAFVSYAAWIQAWYAMGKHSVTATLLIPYYPFYFVECVCMAAFTFVLLLDAIRALLAIFRQEYADEIQKEWI